MQPKTEWKRMAVPFGDISKRTVLLVGAIVWLIVIFGWSLLSYGAFVPDMFLPTPSRVAATAYRMLADGTLLFHTLASAEVVLLGFLVSSLVAVPLGLWVGTYRVAQAALEPLVNFIRYLPVTSFVPLFILWIGIGMEQRITVIFFGTFFQQIVMIADCARGVSRDLVIALSERSVSEPGADRGMVFQSYTLFPWLSVRENIDYGPKRKGFSAKRRAEITDHYLRQVGLTQFADHFPSQLSGGMKQRVAIARALANDPALLLMDEPFGALDSQTRGSMQKLLLKIWEQAQKTVLFVTHDIDEALLLGDRILVMTARPGKIKAEVKVELPRPRSMAMALEPEFIALKRRIIGLLHDEMAEPH